MKIKNVHIVIFPNLLSSSITLPIEMLHAGLASSQIENKIHNISVHYISDKGCDISLHENFKIKADSSANSASYADLIIVPGIWRNPKPIIKNCSNILSYLLNQWENGATIVAVGTGVCLLAESGLLDGLAATTHWHYSKQFKKDYPKVNLKTEFFITQSNRIYCAASLNALADVMVHLVSRLYGKKAAKNVQRNFSHEIRRPYEEQRYLDGAVDRHPDELISDIQSWLKENIKEDIDLNRLAAYFSISPRTLTRRFKNSTGISTKKYIQGVRLEMAKDLLAKTNLTVHEISVAAGYESQAYLSKVFKQHFDLSPTEYRQMVRKKLFTL
ncbi:helix-turn-helix domain-containing protein [Xenorhabdus sp. 12]|uniref:Helix-turn-helix domain-containing protein n=1 Tax=Xenorhabdus santafensis TaxID=2582833 RepID=A0ABU4S5C6_9GAMM|nr:helix-turn-helix domain-containing protein [Xenorhabdus sp. 12]MDX7985848.1 helix-turn-helix domain-containing protein [Xenorhabdus sp. 12]